MEELLQAFLRDGGSFSAWVAQYPLLSERVTIFLSVLRLVKGSRAYADLVAGRNAVHGLYMIALEGRLADAAQVFYLGYVSYCQALLPWAFGREVG